MKQPALDILVALLITSRAERSRCRDETIRLCWDHAHRFVCELLADYQRTGSAERVVPRIDEYLTMRGAAHPVTAAFERELARLEPARLTSRR